MVRFSASSLLVVLAGVIGFVGGAAISAKRGWGSPLVSVVVENRTTTRVSVISLQYSSCGAISSLSAQGLQPGQTHTFRFVVCGEGGYRLDAVLENKMVLSSAAYVESGYKVVESIEGLRIQSRTQTSPF